MDIDVDVGGGNSLHRSDWKKSFALFTSEEEYSRPHSYLEFLVTPNLLKTHCQRLKSGLEKFPTGVDLIRAFLKEAADYESKIDYNAQVSAGTNTPPIQSSSDPSSKSSNSNGNGQGQHLTPPPDHGPVMMSKLFKQLVVQVVTEMNYQLEDIELMLAIKWHRSFFDCLISFQPPNSSVTMSWITKHRWIIRVSIQSAPIRLANQAKYANYMPSTNEKRDSLQFLTQWLNDLNASNSCDPLLTFNICCEVGEYRFMKDQFDVALPLFERAMHLAQDPNSRVFSLINHHKELEKQLIKPIHEGNIERRNERRPINSDLFAKEKARFQAHILDSYAHGINIDETKLPSTILIYDTYERMSKFLQVLRYFQSLSSSPSAPISSTSSLSLSLSKKMDLLMDELSKMDVGKQPKKENEETVRTSQGNSGTSPSPDQFNHLVSQILELLKEDSMQDDISELLESQFIALVTNRLLTQSKLGWKVIAYFIIHALKSTVLSMNLADIQKFLTTVLTAQCNHGNVANQKTVLSYYSIEELITFTESEWNNSNHSAHNNGNFLKLMQFLRRNHESVDPKESFMSNDQYSTMDIDPTIKASSTMSTGSGNIEILESLFGEQFTGNEHLTFQFFFKSCKELEFKGQHLKALELYQQQLSITHPDNHSRTAMLQWRILICKIVAKLFQVDSDVDAQFSNILHEIQTNINLINDNDTASPQPSASELWFPSTEDLEDLIAAFLDEFKFDKLESCFQSLYQFVLKGQYPPIQRDHGGATHVSQKPPNLASLLALCKYSISLSQYLKHHATTVSISKRDSDDTEGPLLFDSMLANVFGNLSSPSESSSFNPVAVTVNNFNSNFTASTSRSNSMLQIEWNFKAGILAKLRNLNNISVICLKSLTCLDHLYRICKIPFDFSSSIPSSISNPGTKAWFQKIKQISLSNEPKLFEFALQLTKRAYCINPSSTRFANALRDLYFHRKQYSVALRYLILGKSLEISNDRRSHLEFTGFTFSPMIIPCLLDAKLYHFAIIAHQFVRVIDWNSAFNLIQEHGMEFPSNFIPFLREMPILSKLTSVFKANGNMELAQRVANHIANPDMNVFNQSEKHHERSRKSNSIRMAFCDHLVKEILNDGTWNGTE